MNDNTLPPDDLTQDLKQLADVVAKRICDAGFVRVEFHLRGVATKVQVELLQPYGVITNYWGYRLDPETRTVLTQLSGGFLFSKDCTQSEFIDQGAPVPDWAYFIVFRDDRGQNT